MPEKPENEMDATLRAYALQRRDNPELRMHPATRRMMQGEVQRTYGRMPKKRGWLSARGWRRLWPYFAVIAVLAFLLLDLVIPKSPRRPEMTLAENKVESPPPATKPQPSPKPKPQSKPVRLDRAVALQPESLPATPGAAAESEDSTTDFSVAYSLRPTAPSQAEPAIQILRDDVVIASDWNPLETIAAVPPAPLTNAVEAGAQFLRYAAAAPASKETNSAAAAVQKAWEARIRALAASKGEASRLGDAAASTETATTSGVAVASRRTSLAGPPPASTGTLASAGVEFVDQKAEVRLPAAKPTGMQAGEQIQSLSAGMSGLTNLGAAHRTWFVQAPNPGAVSALEVLPKFNVERLGEEVRFVDADGSVYQGKMTRQDGLPRFEPLGGDPGKEATVMELLGGAMLKSAGAGDLNITNAVVYNFLVQGTNQTLGAKVAVSGRFVERTNTPALKGIAGVAGDQPVTRSAGVVPRSKAAIVGAAVIGETNTVLFKALAPE